MLSRDVGKRIKEGDINFFEPIKDILQKADILCGNLESPISDNAVRIGAFCAPKKSIEIIKNFHVLNLANNHIYDCGSQGIEDTLYLLKRYNILGIGIGKSLAEAYKPVVIEQTGEKIAFIGCTTYEIFHGIRNYDSKYYIATLGEELEKAIENLRSNDDFIVILVHGGNEFIPFPPPSLMLSLEKLISLGADLVVTHHPHVIGGYKLIEEKNGKKLIWYSLGDFLFDSEVGKRKETGLLTVRIESNKISYFEFIPFYINENYHVEKVDGILAKHILERIKNISSLINREYYKKNYENLYIKEFLSFQKEKFYTIYRKHGLIFLSKYILKSLRYVFTYIKMFIVKGISE